MSNTSHLDEGVLDLLERGTAEGCLRLSEVEGPIESDGLDDGIQEGAIGLIRATEKFDVRRLEAEALERLALEREMAALLEDAA